MLGRVDFTGVQDEFVPVPAGEYDGQTKGWEAKPTKAGDSINIEAKFVFEHVENGQVRTRTFLHRWNLKPGALWRLKRDLIAMGADPEEFEGADVDLEAVLNDLFGAVPTPVTLTFSVTQYTPPNGEPRDQNELVKVVLRDA